MGQPVGREGETRAQVAILSQQGLGPRAIASALGISTQAVYQHLQRIRKDAAREATQ